MLWRFGGDGTRLWTSRVDGVEIGGLAFSTGGELGYLSGRVIAQSWEPTLVLGAFDPDDGGVVALRLFDETHLAGAITDDPPEIAVASTGDIWVVATLTGVVDPADLRGWLGHFSSTGVLQWSTTYDEGVGPDRLLDIAIDSDDYVYVVGAHGTAANDTDILVRAYDQSGQSVWTDIVGGDVPWSEERGTSVAIASGGIVVAGQIADVSGSRWWIRKYAP